MRFKQFLSLVVRLLGGSKYHLIIQEVLIGLTSTSG